MPTFEYLLNIKKEKGGGYLTLLDPDRLGRKAIVETAVRCNSSGVDAILVGSSFLLSNDFDKVVGDIKQNIDIPLVIFPGGINQISAKADAILFLCLVSGRNPEFLIGQQVKSAPIIRSLGLETIPTGYILVESGCTTTAEYISDTRPIPRDKVDIAMAHALAVEYMGMKLVYLDAGSGADLSVPSAMIEGVASYVSLPLVVGGGIRSPEEAQEKIMAGASFVVTGNILESKNSIDLIREFASAVHIKG